MYNAAQCRNYNYPVSQKKTGHYTLADNYAKH